MLGLVKHLSQAGINLELCTYKFIIEGKFEGKEMTAQCFLSDTSFLSAPIDQPEVLLSWLRAFVMVACRTFRKKQRVLKWLRFVSMAALRCQRDQFCWLSILSQAANHANVSPEEWRVALEGARFRGRIDNGFLAQLMRAFRGTGQTRRRPSIRRENEVDAAMRGLRRRRQQIDAGGDGDVLIGFLLAIHFIFFFR